MKEGVESTRCRSLTAFVKEQKSYRSYVGLCTVRLGYYLLEVMVLYCSLKGNNNENE